MPSAPRTGGLAASDASDSGTGHRSALAPPGVVTYGDYLRVAAELQYELDRRAKESMDALIASFPWWSRILIRTGFGAARLHIAIGKFIERLN
jgi:hypothetical protein